jgi:predicted alpha/beta hydrolase
MSLPQRISSDIPAFVHTAAAPEANPAAVTLLTEDGFPLGGTRWLAGGESRGVVLIAPATGAPHRFYVPFAEFLARKGFDTLTWDWRGIGDSRHETSSRDPRFTMRAWGTEDLSAAIAWAERRAPDRPIYFVGHSFGAQALGLATNANRVSRAVFIAGHHGWLGHWPADKRPALRLLWQVLVPLGATLLGRFPSSQLGFGEDLPEGVARELALWCRRREHLGTWEGHASLEMQILALSFADDRIAPRNTVDALVREYRSARVIREHLSETGFGHFDFFRQGFAEEHWQRVVAFLLSAV